MNILLVKTEKNSYGADIQIEIILGIVMETIIEFTPVASSDAHSMICGIDVGSKTFNMIVFDREKNDKIVCDEEAMSIDMFEKLYREFSQDEEVLDKFKYLFTQSDMNLAV